MTKDQLSRYVVMHLAASHSGVAAFRAAAKRHRDSRWGPQLSDLADEVDADRMELHDIANRLRVEPDSLRHRAMRIVLEGAGHASRIIHHATEVSAVVGVESLRNAVAAKTAGWDLLLAVIEDHDQLDRRRLEALVERAHDQHDRLRRIHLEMAREL